MVGHGGIQADMLLEKELRVLHLELQTIGSELSTTLVVP